MSDLPPSNAETGEGPDMAAAELALGLLDGEARAVAIRRVLAEPGFAASVEHWRARLAPLFDLWPDVAAPDIFGRIARTIDRSAAAPVASLTIAPRASSRLWPTLAALSSIAAVGLLALLVTRPLPVPPSAPVQMPATTLVASIDPSTKDVVPLTAIYDAGAGAIRLTEASLTRANRSAELWVIPADGTPHSLGLLHTHGTTALTLSGENRARIAAGATLAVSIEPVGGSRTGLPTGPVVAKGAIATI